MANHEFSWGDLCCGMRGISILKEEGGHSMIQRTFLLFGNMQCLFEGLHKSLSKPVGCWVVRCTSDVTTPLLLIKFSNSIDVNCGPLSVTSWCGSPQRANISLSASIVLEVVVVSIITTSGHFENASTLWDTFFPLEDQQNPHVFSPKVWLHIPKGVEEPAWDPSCSLHSRYMILLMIQCPCPDLATKNNSVLKLSSSLPQYVHYGAQRWPIGGEMVESQCGFPTVCSLVQRLIHVAWWSRHWMHPLLLVASLVVCTVVPCSG